MKEPVTLVEKNKVLNVTVCRINQIESSKHLLNSASIFFLHQIYSNPMRWSYFLFIYLVNYLLVCMCECVCVQLRAILRVLLTLIKLPNSNEEISMKAPRIFKAHVGTS